MISYGDADNFPLKTDSVHRIQLLHQLDTNQCPKSLTFAPSLLQVLQGPLLSSLSSIRAGLTMYLIEDKGGAIAVMLASLLFLGTWPAVLTLLERRGRLPQHTYLDYSLTNLLAAVLIALTFGQLGDSKDGMPNFFTQLGQVRNILAD